MSAQGEVQEAHHDLKEAIASGRLSPQLQERAEGLLQKIERPFRVSVMGLPGSGKSTLLNLLLGANVIPEKVKLPTLQLSYAHEPLIQCTLPDGTQKSLPGDDLYALVELKPAFAQINLPLPALSKLSMMEVVAGADEAEQARAIQWATKRTDIALWCSATSFDENEEDIWAHTSEKVQDHAFLLLTKADDPAAAG
ncbi:MAG: GTPase, partial [Pseudomonadota bacterium]